MASLVHEVRAALQPDGDGGAGDVEGLRWLRCKLLLQRRGDALRDQLPSVLTAVLDACDAAPHTSLPAINEAGGKLLPSRIVRRVLLSCI